MRVYILYVDGKDHSLHKTIEGANAEATSIQSHYPEARIYIGSIFLYD